MGAVTVDREFCSYLARDVALYADNDAVECIPARWNDYNDDQDNQNDFDQWQNIGELCGSIIVAALAISTAIPKIETQIGIDPHSVIENCASDFDLPPDCRVKAAVLAKIAPYLTDVFDTCGSPIERMMAFGLLVTFAIYSTTEWFWTDGFLSLGSYADQGDVTLGQQVQLGEYRVDFLLGVSGCNRAIVIECDGHDFHERTKAQAQRDKSRDRWLQMHGYMVFRYTGTEIYKNTADCGGQVFDALRSLRDHAA